MPATSQVEPGHGMSPPDSSHFFSHVYRKSRPRSLACQRDAGVQQAPGPHQTHAPGSWHGPMVRTGFLHARANSARWQVGAVFSCLKSCMPSGAIGDRLLLQSPVGFAFPPAGACTDTWRSCESTEAASALSRCIEFVAGSPPGPRT